MDLDGGLAHLEREHLATLVPEYLLAGHLIDRAGMPHPIAAFGREVSSHGHRGVEEGSPVYTRRMQDALGFRGDYVETIFKGLQLDIGAPPSSWISAISFTIAIMASSSSITAAR